MAPKSKKQQEKSSKQVEDNAGTSDEVQEVQPPTADVAGPAPKSPIISLKTTSGADISLPHQGNIDPQTLDFDPEIHPASPLVMKAIDLVQMIDTMSRRSMQDAKDWAHMKAPALIQELDGIYDNLITENEIPEENMEELKSLLGLLKSSIADDFPLTWSTSIEDLPPCVWGVEVVFEIDKRRKKRMESLSIYKGSTNPDPHMMSTRLASTTISPIEKSTQALGRTEPLNPPPLPLGNQLGQVPPTAPSVTPNTPREENAPPFGMENQDRARHGSSTPLQGNVNPRPQPVVDNILDLSMLPKDFAQNPDMNSIKLELGGQGEPSKLPVNFHCQFVPYPQSGKWSFTYQFQKQLPNHWPILFDGEKCKLTITQLWKFFWQQVHQYNLSDQEKLTCLYMTLDGNAKKLISNFLFSSIPDSYQRAVETLFIYYGDSITSRHELDNRVKNLRPRSSSAADNLAYIRSLYECYQSYASLGYDVNQAAYWTMDSAVRYVSQIHMIGYNSSLRAEKLDDITLANVARKWESFIRGIQVMLCNEIRNKGNLEDLVSSETYMAVGKDSGTILVTTGASASNSNKNSSSSSQNAKSQKKNSQGQKDDTKGKQSNSQGESSKEIKPCYFCKEGHLNRDCPLSITDRRNAMKANRRCFNCLGQGHNASDCKHDSRCRECTNSKFKHATTLCTKGSKSKSGSSSNQKEEQKKPVPALKPFVPAAADAQGQEKGEQANLAAVPPPAVI